MIPEKNPYNNWSGNGSTTTFDFDFYIEDETQLAVYHTNSQGVQTTLRYGVDYSINELKKEEGSFINFPLASSTYSVLGEGEVISLCLTLPIAQLNEYGKSDFCDLKAIEYSLDYLTRICQIINRQMVRAVKTQEGSSQSADELIEALQQAQVNAAASATAAASAENAAANSATIAGEEATIATQKTAEVSATYEAAMSDIANKRATSLDDIDTAKSGAQSAIQADREDALGAISSLNNSSQSAISNLASQATSDISQGIENISNDITTGRGEISNDLASAILNLTNKATELGERYLEKANIIWYADRDFEYRQPDYLKTNKTTVTIKAGTAIRVPSSEHFYTAHDLTFNIADTLDTGNIANGKDYYFYLNNDKQLITSLNEVAPQGYTENDVVKIGGGHTMCVTVGNDAPTLLADSFWAEHPYKGYSINDFMPNTVWTPAFRSNAKTGNKGMALVDYYGFEKFWADMYLQSGTGASTASSYSGTITNNRQCILHEQDMRMVGKSLPKDWQFSIMSEGSNQKTNIQGGAIPSGKLTGGYKDTAGKWMISGFGLWCCCGYLWQWGDEIAPAGGSGWSSYADTNRGGSYGVPYVLRFGGNYDSSSYCGSWSRACSATRTIAYAYGGARGVSLHIERVHS